MQYLLSIFINFRFLPIASNRLKSILSMFLACVFGVVIVCYGAWIRSGDQHIKDFWVDEVWRAQQILHASDYKELQEGNYYGAEAPVQWSEYLFGKVGLQLFGTNEFAFRVWPLMFSLCSLLLFFYISFSILSPSWALCALFLFSISIGQVEHAHEFKPYAFEVFMALLSLAIGLWIDQYENTKSIDDERCNNINRNWLFVICFALIAVLTNLLAFFFFLPCFLLYRCNVINVYYRRISYPAIFCLCVLFFVCSVCALWYYGGYILQLRDNSIFAFWNGFYLGDTENWPDVFTDTIPYTMYRYVFSYSNVVKTSIAFSIFCMACVLIIGPVCMWYRSSMLFVFVSIPLFVQIVLSLLCIYPFFSRVSAFYYSYVLLSLCFVGDSLESVVPIKMRRICDLVLVVMVCAVIANYVFKVDRANHIGANVHIERIKPFIARINEDLINDVLRNEYVLVTNYSVDIALKFYQLAEETKVNVVRVRMPDQRKLTILGVKEFLSELRKKYPDTKIYMLAYHDDRGFDLFLEAAKDLNIAVSDSSRAKGAFMIEY